jgi:hypothetical protein
MKQWKEASVAGGMSKEQSRRDELNDNGELGLVGNLKASFSE